MTDGESSFVMFNYANLTWTSGTRSGGDAQDGLGGTAAQVYTATVHHTYTLVEWLRLKKASK